MANCTNCGELLGGKFCQNCGQKRFVESDRRFAHLLHQFLTSATDLDGRIWRSVRALLFQPGLLSGEYMLGRRARWIAPATLFLAVNLVYFLAPLHGDLALQFNQQVSGRMVALASDPGVTLSAESLARTGQAHTPITQHLIDRRVQARDEAARAASHGERGYGYRDYRLAYDAKADDVSKTLVMFHVPFAALALMVLLVDQRRYFAEHFVFALHFFAFALVALQIAVHVQALAKFALPAAYAPSDALLDGFIRVLFPLYAVLALRRAYAISWRRAVVAAAGMLFVVVSVNLYIYRAVQFLVTFALS